MLKLLLVGARGQGWPADVFVPGLGGLFAAIYLGPLQALVLSLRVLNGFRQHLPELSLGLRWLARKTLCPCGHTRYMGMPEAELKPSWDR